MRPWAAMLLVAAVNIVAHFLPFERAALAPDDYATLVRIQTLKPVAMVREALRTPDRPLHDLIVMAQARWAGDNAVAGLWLVVASSTLVTLAVYGLLCQVLGGTGPALLGALVFCLLPNKLETYHTPIYFNMNVVFAVFLCSLVLFIRHAQRGGRIALVGSALLYALGLFWYEVGFFLPIILLAYSGWFARQRLASVAWFALPAGLYTTYRLTMGFGLSEAQASLHQVGLVNVLQLPHNLLDLVHHYVGRYIIRSTLYGLTQVWTMDRVWLVVAVVADGALLWLLARWMDRLWPVRLERRVGWLGLAMFAGFVLPILLNERIGVGGRHLALPSAGLALGVLVLLGRSQARAWRVALMAVLGVGLLVSQGNAWAQVVACRINGAVYATLKERRTALVGAERVILDTRSFADRIPFTWIQQDFNTLNTYYGAQAFEDWGLLSMARLVLGDAAVPVYIATRSPQARGADRLAFTTAQHTGYRAVAETEEVVPRSGTVIVDFQQVFGDQFRNGRRPVIGAPLNG